MGRFSTRAGIAALFLAVALWPISSAAGQDYEVRLHRPSKVGDKQHVSARVHVTTKQTLKAGDKVLQDETEDYTAECDGVQTILEVDQKGEPSKLSVAVEKCTRTGLAAAPAAPGDGKPAPGKLTASEFLPQGATVVLTSKAQDTAVEINGQPAEAVVQDALSELFPLTPNSPTDDEFFGTTERKKAGDRWAGNADLLSKDLMKHGIVVKKEAISSTVTLEKAVTVGKIPCLQISGQLDVSGLEPPGMPTGFQVDKSASQVRFEGKYPVAAEAQTPESSSVITITFIGRSPPNSQGPALTVEMVKSVDHVRRLSDVQ